MRIAILSDSHDNIGNLNKVVEQVKQTEQAVIFCGDFCAPFSAGILAKTGLPTFACLGNNDEDQIGLLRQGGQNFNWVNLSQEFGEVEFEGHKFAYCHYPKLAELLAGTGEYQAVFFGHTHQGQIKPVGNTLLVNPGPICGIQGGEESPASYAVYDTATNNAEIIPLLNKEG